MLPLSQSRFTISRIILPTVLFLLKVVCIPFAWFNEAVEPITWNSQDWMGSVQDGWWWHYADYMLLLTFGGIPWQVGAREGKE